MTEFGSWSNPSEIPSFSKTGSWTDKMSCSAILLISLVPAWRCRSWYPWWTSLPTSVAITPTFFRKTDAITCNVARSYLVKICIILMSYVKYYTLRYFFLQGDKRFSIQKARVEVRRVSNNAQCFLLACCEDWRVYLSSKILRPVTTYMDKII